MNGLSDILLGVLMMTMGLWFVISRRGHARYTAQLNRDMFGIRFQDRFYELAFLLGGAAIALVGAVILLKAIPKI